MEFRSADVGGDPTMSRGQATLRRFMRGNISDRMLTPASGGKIEPRLGSVSALGVSPVRSIRFSELTAAETISLPLHFSDNGEGRRTPDWESRGKNHTRKASPNLSKGWESTVVSLVPVFYY
jgi:hypothetical protein